MRNYNYMKFINKEEILSLLQGMIRLNTVNKPGNERILAKFIKEILDDLLVENYIDELGNNRANVYGTIKGSGERPTLLLNGHLDTVPIGDVNWKYSPFGGEIVNGKVYGRGSTDMKGGLVAMLIAVKIVKMLGWKLKGNLIYSATAGEEDDSIGAIKFVEDGGLEGVGAIIIGEPTSNNIVISEKGTLWLEITTYGKIAHAAFPNEGLNAIVYMNYVMKELLNYGFNYRHNKILGLPTLNISTINGGVKTNIVPDKCIITVDIRTVPGMDHNDIINDIKNILSNLEKNTSGFMADLKIINDRVAIETNEEDKFVQLAVQTVSDLFGKDIRPWGVNFYTDASIFLATKKFPCVIYGPGDPTMAHKPDEYVLIESLIEAIQFYCEIIKRFLVC